MDQKVDTLIRKQSHINGDWTGRQQDPVLNPATGAEVLTGGKGHARAIWRVTERLDFGINEGIISTELAPFGGMKESGLGRQGSHHGVEEFVEIKCMFLGGLDS